MSEVTQGVKSGSILSHSIFGHTHRGNEQLATILGKGQFDNPKPIDLIFNLIKLAENSREITVLDFFAGSGTTGQAVMMLNKDDGGNRKFILCTNNENGIAEEVCYPRIQNVIKGYSNVEGIPANVRYFKTSFVSKSKISDDTKSDLVHKSTEMICVKENTFNKIKDTENYKLYKNNEIVIGIVFNLEAIESFKEELNTQDKEAHVYVFSLTSDTYTQDFEDLSVAYELCPIPESILEVYRKLFK